MGSIDNRSTASGGNGVHSAFDLSGKTVLVTGASRGLGRDMAIAFGEAGANVVLTGRDSKALDEATHATLKAGGRAVATRMEVTDRASIDRAVQQSVEAFGTIDVLVNNAGIVSIQPFLKATEEEWSRVLDVNLLGVFRCCQAVGRLMVEKKSGKIINISSIAAIGGQAGLCGYSSTKGAVLTMTKVFALELSPHNIQVNAILPGTTDTGMAKAAMADPNWTKQVLAGIPMKRLGRTRDLLGAVLYFATEDSDYCTGQTLIVDGGYSMV
jgi:gluconate 5-dehydrogenase